MTAPTSTSSLSRRARHRAAIAARSGALHSLASDRHWIEENGIRFVVRVLAELHRKERTTADQNRTGTNPFLPYDPALFVADLSETHVCLLNKFNVVDLHLLIVTRRFEPQESALDLPDFEALWRCLGEIDGLGFYNAGAAAGASQPHKHLQLIRTPLGRGPERCPVEPALGDIRRQRDPAASPELPFAHAAIALEAAGRGESLDRCAAESHAAYRSLLEVLDRDAAAPYNLLVTRSWMLLVPRSRERFGSISVNALGYAGSLLVRNTEQLERVRAAGPLRILREVGEAPRPI